MLSNLSKIALRYLPLLLLAVAWEGASRIGLFSKDALPPLSQVLASLIGMLHGNLAGNAGASLYRASAGLTLAIVIGVPLGILMAWWRWLNAFMSPIVESLYPLPKTALIPVTAIWLGFGDGSKILLISLGCMVPVVIAAFNGAKGSEQELVWSARSMGASHSRILRDVVLPSALPEILTGVRIAIALSFILLVSSELLASRHGLGFLIGYFADGGVYKAMYAAVLAVSIMGFAADRLYTFAMRRALRWRE